MKTAMMNASVLLLPTLLLAACGGGSGGGSVAVTTTPTTSTTTSTTYLGVAAGGGHTVAIKSDGTKPEGSLLAWGLNRNGQVGDGTSVEKTVPTQVGVNTAATGSIVSAGEFHTAALSGCGTAGCSLSTWGSNFSGQLGDGTAAGRLAPTKLTGTNWLFVSAGASHTAAIKKDGTLWTWGGNSNGQLGLGKAAVKDTNGVIVTPEVPNFEDTRSPTQEATKTTKWSAVSAGAVHTLGILLSGNMASWGSNDRGQLGVGVVTPTPYSYAVSVSTTQKFLSASAGGDHNLAIATNSTLWAWGANGSGQVGNGTLADVSAPVQIGTAKNWERVSAGGGHNDVLDNQTTNGGHSLAIDKDGKLWAWGSNAYGQLGTGTTEDATAPTQVGTDTDWIGVSAGKFHSFAWKGDKSLWAWGNNQNGQLGNGSSGTSAKNILVPTRLP